MSSWQVILSRHGCRRKGPHASPAPPADLVEGVRDLAEGVGADGVEQLDDCAGPHAARRADGKNPIPGPAW